MSVDRPHRKKVYPGNPPYIKPFAVCLAAGILSIAILSYMTSFKNLHSRSQLVDKTVLSTRYDSVNSWVSTDAAKETNIESTSLIALTYTNSTFEVKSNCTGANMTLKLFSQVPSHFLPNYKNPCWYEPLVKADVYEGNRYKEHYMLNELVKEWSKRLLEQRDPKRLRCLPYFFLAGQPKCGTSDLYEKLTSHPDIVTTPMKEPHWWTKRRFGEYLMSYKPWTSVPFQDYLDLFDTAAFSIEANSSQGDEGYHQIITGDASASTLWFNDYWWKLEENCGQTGPRYIVADYLRYLLPNSKFIVILRNPTERLYSDFLALQKPPKSPDIFHNEVVRAISSLQTCLHISTMRSCIHNRTIADYSRARLRIGIYYVFLQEWMRVFPRQQFLILRLDEYSRNKTNTLKNVFKFLGLRPLTSEEEKGFIKPNVANVRGKKHRELGDMRVDTRRLLDNFYRHYNQKLSILLHDHRYFWPPK